MVFGQADPKVKWCEVCGGLWDEDSSKCTNTTCIKGQKLGVGKPEEEELNDEDGILDDPEAPFIVNTILNLVQCKACKSEWNTHTNFCSNPECTNSETFLRSTATHEPPPLDGPNSRPVTVLLMAILNQSGYLGLANALKHRAREGALKYGTMLKSHNGRNAELDALQESLDLNQYLFQCLVERDTEIKRLKEKLRQILFNANYSNEAIEEMINEKN